MTSPAMLSMLAPWPSRDAGPAAAAPPCGPAQVPASPGRGCPLAVSSCAVALCLRWRRQRVRSRRLLRCGVRCLAAVEAPAGRGPAAVIDGKAIATEVRREVRARAEELRVRCGTTPGLAVVLVGSRADSLSYVRSKVKAAEEVGCRVVNQTFPEETSEDELLQCIGRLNEDPEVHGILVQLPLPPGMDERRILNAIDVRKDVDGLSSYNLGCLAQPQGAPLAVPCTPAGCMELLRRSGVDVSGKDCLVLGRSGIVGLPMALLLIRANATVKVCHSYSQGIAGACAEADILIAAVGQPGFVHGDWLKRGCVVIDVGINRVPDRSKKRGYRLAGDVDSKSARRRASMITPVPGGVGPMTVAMLLKNTVELAFQGALDARSRAVPHPSH